MRSTTRKFFSIFFKFSKGEGKEITSERAARARAALGRTLRRARAPGRDRREKLGLTINQKTKNLPSQTPRSQAGSLRRLRRRRSGGQEIQDLRKRGHCQVGGPDPGEGERKEAFGVKSDTLSFFSTSTKKKTKNQKNQTNRRKTPAPGRPSRSPPSSFTRKSSGASRRSRRWTR